MAQWTAPGISLTTGFTPGESGWGDEYNADMLKLSVLVQLRVLSRVIWPPIDDSNSAAVAAGDMYIVPASDSNSMQDSNSAPAHGMIAAFGGPVGEETWRYFTPLNGFLAYVIDEGAFYRYLNGVWLPFGGDAAAILYNSGTGGDSNSTETNVADALDDLYERVRNVSAGIVDASTVSYNSGRDSNSADTTVQEALDSIFGGLINHEARIDALEAASGDSLTFTTLNANHTLTAADDKTFYLVGHDSNSAAFIDIGIPEDGLEDLPDGFTVSATHLGDSQVRFVAIEDSNSPGAAVLIYPADMQPQSRTQNSTITALKTNIANTWIIFGDLEPV